MQQDGCEVVQAVLRVEKAVRKLPDRQFIGWDNDDTAEVEQHLGEREANCRRGS